MKEYSIDQESVRIVDPEFDLDLICVPTCCYTDLRETFVKYDRWPMEIVVDLGAHYGSLSLMAAARGARVIAVEPVWFKPLVTNITNNCLSDKIIPLPLVVTRDTEREKIRLASSGNDGMIGAYYQASSVCLRAWAQSISFRNIMRLCPDGVDYLKVDIEGSEYEIFAPDLALRTGRRTWSTSCWT
jgi:FkbM family methyltransferase